MEPLAIGLVIISAAFHALRDFLTKKSEDKQIFMWLFDLAALILFLPPVIYVLSTEGFHMSSTGLKILLISGAIHSVYWFFLSKSLEHGDLSHVYPIIRSSPALVLVLSLYLLSEDISKPGVIGIAVVVLGVYIINLKRINLSGIFEPIRSVFTEKAPRYAILTMFCVAGYSIADKVGVQHIHPILLVYLLSLIGISMFTPYILLTKKRSEIIHEWRMNTKNIIINGFLVLSGYALILFAMKTEPVSYVVGLRQLSIVFAVLLGGQILNEGQKSLRLVAAVTIFIGAFLITIAT